MAWTDQIFGYCERAGDGSFWAEPFNAVSNGAFLIAALAAAWEWRSRKDAPAFAAVLVAFVFVIGVGSFLFHTYATWWAVVADVAPISLFMFAYLGFALRRFLHLPWVWVALGVIALVATRQGFVAIPCPDPSGVWASPGSGRCLNGTMGYAPAFLAMLLTGAALAIARHAAAKYLLAAAVVFLASMAFRTVDWAACEETVFLGRARGTHALWHVLNAVTLYLLLAAAIRHGGARRDVASARA